MARRRSAANGAASTTKAKVAPATTLTSATGLLTEDLGRERRLRAKARLSEQAGTALDADLNASSSYAPREQATTYLKHTISGVAGAGAFHHESDEATNVREVFNVRAFHASKGGEGTAS